jgi:ABC-type bacteriocin/lantibiotic exporter with double-glycine peptidase domain
VIKTKGSNISGGQKQRVSLARALYTDSDIVILDNSFSSMDNNVAFSIMENAILPLKQAGKIIIVATCDKKWLHFADKVYLFDNNTTKKLDKSSITDSNFTNYSYEQSDRTEVPLSTSNDSEAVDSDNKRVSISTYMYYFKKAGVIGFIFVIVWVALMQFGRNFIEIWLANWVNTENDNTASETNIRLYVLFVLTHTVVTILRSERFASVCLKASKEIYEEFITSLLTSKINFFMKNDIARLSNILQNEIFEIDEKIPFELNRLLAFTFAILGSLLVLGYSSLYFLIISFFVAVYYINIFKDYNPASRLLQKKLADTKGKYMGVFLDTIE